MNIKSVVIIVVALIGWGQASAITISGSIESQSFFIEGKRFSKLESNCLSNLKLNGTPSSVDDIYISVNGASKQHLRNGPSYWHTASEICEQIITYTKSVATEERESGRGAGLSAKGQIESNTFFFEARHPKGIQLQCMNFHEAQSIAEQVDDIHVSVNGGDEVHLRNGPSYWRTASEVCEQISNHIKNLGFGKGPDRPVRCGEHGLGEIWYHLDEENPIVSHKSCKNGRTGQVVVTTERLVEYECTRRGPRMTGNESEGELLSRVRQCQRPKRSCRHPKQGVFADGEPLLQVVPGQPLREDVQCLFGGEEFNLYKQLKPMVCNDGVIEPTGGDPQRGGFIKTSKRRCDAPQPCGAQAHESFWDEAVAGKPVRRKEVCGAGNRGKQVVVYNRKRTNSCYNGKVTEGQPVLVEKRRRACEMFCGKAYGTNTAVLTSQPRGGRDADVPAFVVLPANTKVGTVKTVQCSRYVAIPVEPSTSFRCNSKGLWVPGWDLTPRRDGGAVRGCTRGASLR